MAATGLEFGVNAGFLQAGVRNGAVTLDGDITVRFIDPNDNGQLTLAELVGTSLTDLVKLTPAGSLDVTLPIQATLGEASLFQAGARPTIRITDTDLFGGAAPKIDTPDFEELLNFNNITPGSFVGLLRQLGAALGQFSDISIFNTAIPFTQGKTLADVLDISAAFAKSFTDLLEAVPDGAVAGSPPTPTFEHAEQLARQLASKLGLDPSDINPRYVPKTNELTFHVEFKHQFAEVKNVSLDFSAFDLGPLAVTAASKVDVGANLEFAFTMGIDLSGLLPDNTPNNETDNDSLLDHFFIEDASIAGEVTFTAKDITLAAHLGFLGIGVSGGTANANAAVELKLQDPEGGRRSPSGRQSSGTSRSRRLDLGELRRFIVAGKEEQLIAGDAVGTGATDRCGRHPHRLGAHGTAGEY